MGLARLIGVFSCFLMSSKVAEGIGAREKMNGTFKIEYGWLGDKEGGYIAHFKVPVEMEIPSWWMALIFPEPIYNITAWQATFMEMTKDGRVVYFKQTQWNGHQWPGGVLDQRFMVRFNLTPGIDYNGYAGPKPDILFIDKVYRPQRYYDYEHNMKVEDFKYYSEPLPKYFRMLDIATLPATTTKQTTTTQSTTTEHDPFGHLQLGGTDIEWGSVQLGGKWAFISRFQGSSGTRAPTSASITTTTTNRPLLWWQLDTTTTTPYPVKPTPVAVDCSKSIEDRKRKCKARKRSMKRCFLPQCADDGRRFKAVQCWRRMGYCWCVDTLTGVKMVKTVVKFKKADELNCFVGDQSRTDPITTSSTAILLAPATKAYVPEEYADGGTIPRPVFAPRQTYDYTKVIHNSHLFFEAQRSGDIGRNGRVSWRLSAHTRDGSECGHDLSGGYYNAGDYIKFGFPAAFAMTQLAWGFLESKDAYDAAWQTKFLKDTLKWGADYFIKAHVSDYELYGQVGDPIHENELWTRPQDMKAVPRPCYAISGRSPGSDLAAETAAALAATAQVWMTTGAEKTDPYVQLLLKHAEQLFQFADKYRGIYSNSMRAAANHYPSSGYGDELTWAALWLYSATGDEQYLANAQRKYYQFTLYKPVTEFSWDLKTAGVQLLMAKYTRKRSYMKPLTEFCDSVLPGGDATYTPYGLLFTSKWGPIRYALNAGFICMGTSRLDAIGDDRKRKYRKFAEDQIDYVLGKTGKSFVIGFGVKFPTQPNHRASSCSMVGTCDTESFKSPEPNPQTLTGAVVGGPDQNDNWTNDRTNGVTNAVSLDFNSALQSSVALLRQLQIEYKAWSDSQWRQKSN